MSGVGGTGAGAGATQVISPVTGGDDEVPPYPTSWKSDYNKSTFPTDASPKSQLRGDDNYAIWVEKMDIGWRVAGLWNVVTGIHPHPEKDEPAGVVTTWMIMNNNAVSIIYNAVDGSMVTGLASFTEAREMWESLTTKHAGGGMGSLLTKVCRINSLYDMNETSMGNHTTRFTGIITEIKQAGFIIPTSLLLLSSFQLFPIILMSMTTMLALLRLRP
jgi:hypothetical protein